MVPQANQAEAQALDHQDLQETQVPLDPLDPQDQMANLVKLEAKEPQVRKDHQDPKVNPKKNSFLI